MNYLTFAENVPSLGSGGIAVKELLIKHASALSDGDVIIDIGSYLGSTTAFLSAGLLSRNVKATIHCYDPWEVDELLRRKMDYYNGLHFNVGDDLLPVFDAYLAPFDEVNIIRHKQSILDARWHGPKIRLVVDDICIRKDKNDHMMKTFIKYFIPGETIIIRLDYYFYETKSESVFSYEKRFMEHNRDVFEFVQRGPKESRAAVFKYLGGTPDYEVEQ